MTEETPGSVTERALSAPQSPVPSSVTVAEPSPVPGAITVSRTSLGIALYSNELGGRVSFDLGQAIRLATLILNGVQTDPPADIQSVANESVQVKPTEPAIDPLGSANTCDAADAAAAERGEAVMD